jgi:hypothetical protein
VTKRKKVKLLHVGRYVAEVDVELVEDETGWSPYLSIEDSLKLDDVRKALKRGDLMEAAAVARVYELRPVASR